MEKYNKKERIVMKTMETKATKFLDALGYEFQTEESRKVLWDLYLRMFYYDIPTHEIEDWLVDVFNSMKREFEE